MAQGTEEMLIASLADKIAGEAKRVWGVGFGRVECWSDTRGARWQAFAYSGTHWVKTSGATAAEAARLLLDRLKHMAPRVRAIETNDAH